LPSADSCADSDLQRFGRDRPIEPSGEHASAYLIRQPPIRTGTHDPLEFVSQVRVGVSQHLMGFIDQFGEEIHTGGSRQRVLVFSNQFGHLLRDSLEANEPLDPTPSQRHIPSLIRSPLNALASSYRLRAPFPGGESLRTRNADFGCQRVELRVFKGGGSSGSGRPDPAQSEFPSPKRRKKA
jgi:hypothetical protein